MDDLGGMTKSERRSVLREVIQNTDRRVKELLRERPELMQNVIDVNADTIDDLPENALVVFGVSSWATFNARDVRSNRGTESFMKSALCRERGVNGNNSTRTLGDLLRSYWPENRRQYGHMMQLTGVPVRNARNDVTTKSFSALLRRECCLLSDRRTRDGIQDNIRRRRQERQRREREREEEQEQERRRWRLPPPSSLSDNEEVGGVVSPAPSEGEEQQDDGDIQEILVLHDGIMNNREQQAEIVDRPVVDDPAEPEEERAPKTRRVECADAEEERYVSRKRELVRFSTFMPPSASDVVSSNNTVCAVCHDDIRLDELVATGNGTHGSLRDDGLPCVFGPQCRECTELMLDSSVKACTAPTCTYCREHHVLPSSLFARVVHADAFVRARKTLVNVKQGRLPGWEATVTCPNSACGRAGVLLCMNSPSFSCSFCHAAPRDGWCCFCMRPYDSSHCCSEKDDERGGPSVTVADILGLIEQEHRPYVAPCPRCLEIVEKQNEYQCNHMTCNNCRTEYCGMCGKSPWFPNHAVFCRVAKAHFKRHGDAAADVDTISGPMYLLARSSPSMKASVVNAYARVLREELPAALVPLIHEIEEEDEASELDPVLYMGY